MTCRTQVTLEQARGHYSTVGVCTTTTNHTITNDDTTLMVPVDQIGTHTHIHTLKHTHTLL